MEKNSINTVSKDSFFEYESEFYQIIAYLSLQLQWKSSSDSSNSANKNSTGGKKDADTADNLIDERIKNDIYNSFEVTAVEIISISLSLIANRNDMLNRSTNINYESAVNGTHRVINHNNIQAHLAQVTSVMAYCTKVIRSADHVNIKSLDVADSVNKSLLRELLPICLQLLGNLLFRCREAQVGTINSLISFCG